jgi:hypothetical protein
MNLIERLTTTDRITSAREAFNQVFQSSNPFNSPFSPQIESKAILFPSSYLLNSEQYDAIVVASNRIGDTTAYYSSTESYRLGRVRFEEGTHAVVQLRKSSHDSMWKLLGNVQWESAIYAIDGRWGAMSSNDVHAVVGGPTEFIETLDRLLGLQRNLDEFLDYLIDQHNRFQSDLSWVVELLSNTYGEQQSSRLLSAKGFSPIHLDDSS